MKVLIGNMFESSCQCLVNTINCVGVMGRGVALEFKKRYPENYFDYVKRCEAKEVKPGLPYFYQNKDRLILNFPTKDHWRMPSRLSDVEAGLDWFLAHYKESGVNSIAFPPLGCGNGGLDWKDVGPLMYRKLKDLPIEIEAYAPYGTSAKLLDEAFLALASPSKDAVGRQQKIRPSWLLILEAIKELNERKYALNVGRIIYQKICYIMTYLGLDTGFLFKKSSYGPFSYEAKEALGVMANANLLNERKLGDMIQIEVDEGFRFDENRYSRSDIAILRRTVDLFARVHSTAQAEIIGTVVFSFQELSKSLEPVDDEALFAYVSEWKPDLAKERRNELLSTIYYLKLYGFISLQVPKDSKLIGEVDLL